MKIMIGARPNALPCGTSVSNITIPSTTTLWVQLWIYLSVSPWIPTDSSFFNSLTWGKQPMVLLKSITCSSY